ncbi:MAG: alpha-ketoacid dehydrogenase subunit beta, partial [Chloroflexi bacterium]|nr:alpha-ketoacid dehydrogenase subunit beta [Chloroflexota bacterium]
MVEKRLIEAVREGLREELAADPDVFLIGQDIGINGGVFRVTEGLLEEFGPRRVIDSPLAESGMVGVAIGAAMNGLRPVVEIQFADFIFPAFNQLVSEAARMYYRTNGEFAVPLVIRAPYGGGVRGGLYHSQSVEAYFAHVPGLKVVVPSSPHDAKGLLKAAIRDDNPVLFFEHKLAYNTVRG